MMQKIKPQTMPANSKPVGILGVFPFAGISPELIEHGLEHLEQDGYEPVFLENLEDVNQFEAAKLQLNWVVATSGLPTAQYLEKEKGIPYIAAFPVGMRGMRQWRKHLARLLGYEDAIEVPNRVESKADAPKVLLLGDPVLTAGMKSYFQEMLGYTSVLRAHYAPMPSVQEWFDKVLARAQGHGLQTDLGEIELVGSVTIGNEQALEQLLIEMDIVIGDKTLKPTKFGDKQLWIDLPECLSSCQQQETPYQLFGKKGAAWLGERLALAPTTV